ncbi:hypothetical protein [Nocardiopsis quinghaiensis]|uniref:hypothetical protein n=1 Tax=Nocardiopsis quinghaiensis TaxID=464995 RepID=UPI001CC25D18|nr:hypothetical protein [Nocardiopsis quinghaiensis]
MVPKKKTINMVCVVVAAFLMAPMGTAAASPTPSGAGPDAAPSAQPATECSDNGAETTGAEQDDAYDMTLIDGAPAERLAADVAALVGDGEVTVHASAEALARDGAKAYQIKADSDQPQHTSVSVPISGGYSEPLSNLTVLLDAEGAVVQYAETLYSQADSGNFHISSYVDGALTKSGDTGIPFVGDEQLRDEVAAANEAVAESASTGACVAAVLGVSGAVGAAIAYACVGSCSVPMTPVTAPVCAACIGGFAVVGGASITAIASCF